MGGIEGSPLLRRWVFRLHGAPDVQGEIAVEGGGSRTRVCLRLGQLSLGGCFLGQTHLGTDGGTLGTFRGLQLQGPPPPFFRAFCPKSFRFALVDVIRLMIELSDLGMQMCVYKNNTPVYQTEHTPLCHRVHIRFKGGQRMAKSQICKKRFHLYS